MSHPLDERAREHKERGAALLTKGKLEAALSEFERAVTAAPRDVMARRKVAELLARLGRNGQAVEAYQVLVGRFAAEGRFLEAISLCKVILQLDPRHVETQTTLSRLYAQKESRAPLPRIDHAKLAELSRMPTSMSAAIDLTQARAARPSLPRPRLGPRDSEAPVPLPSASRDARTIPVMSPVRAAQSETNPDPEVDIVTSELPSTPLFSELPADVMQVLLERLTMLPFAKGETIIAEGETGRSLFVVASGEAEVIRRGPGGERTLIDRMPAGTFFGEIGLVADVPRIATVVAVEDTVVLEVSRELVAELSLRFPALDGLVRDFYKSRLLQNLLRSGPLFAPLNPIERADLVERFTVQRAERGEILLQQGSPGPGLFLLLRGRCGVSFRDTQGEDHPLPDLSEGAVMGEISLMNGSPVTATVKALRDSILLFLEKGPVDEFLLSNPGARAQMARSAQERLQRTEALEQKIPPLDPAFL
jgi:cAMP-dependent protein kinase regulator